MSTLQVEELMSRVLEECPDDLKLKRIKKKNAFFIGNSIYKYSRLNYPQRIYITLLNDGSKAILWMSADVPSEHGTCLTKETFIAINQFILVLQAKFKLHSVSTIMEHLIPR